MCALAACLLLTPKVRKQTTRPKMSWLTDPAGWKKTGRQTIASLRAHSISCPYHNVANRDREERV